MTKQKIKFRAWSKSERCFIYSADIDESTNWKLRTTANGALFLERFGQTEDGMDWEETIEDLDLASGVRDKGSKLIYESDIIETDNTLSPDVPRHTPVIVKRDETGLFFNYGFSRFYLGNYEGCHLKILGNIYEDPNLCSR